MIYPIIAWGVLRHTVEVDHYPDTSKLISININAQNIIHPNIILSEIDTSKIIPIPITMITENNTLASISPPNIALLLSTNPLLSHQSLG